MDKIFERFYAAADAILAACVGDFNSSNVESGDDLSQLPNIRVIAHDMDDDSIYVYICIHKNSADKTFSYPEIQTNVFGYSASSEEVFINAYYDLPNNLWDVNPPEDDDLEDINFEELVSIMEKSV